MYDNSVCTDTCLSCVSTAGFTTNVQPAANCIAPDSRFSALTTIVSLQARVQSCSFHNKKGLAPANPLYIFYFSDILQTKYDYVFSYFLPTNPQPDSMLVWFYGFQLISNIHIMFRYPHYFKAIMFEK